MHTVTVTVVNIVSILTRERTGYGLRVHNLRTRYIHDSPSLAKPDYRLVRVPIGSAFNVCGSSG